MRIRNLFASLFTSCILYSGKYFIDTHVLPAYTSALKKRCFIKYQVIGASPQNRLRAFRPENIQNNNKFYNVLLKVMNNLRYLNYLIN